MKKLMCLIAASAIFIGGIVFADEIVSLVDEIKVTDSSMVQKAEQLQTAPSEVLNTKDMLTAVASKSENLNDEIKAYALFISSYNVTDDEQKYISSLIKQGKRMSVIAEIYDFWQYTDEDISIIEDVYAYYPDDAEENNVQYWIDAAFLHLSENGKTTVEYSDLSYEQVMEYYNQGISFDEILYADKLSRKGVKPIEDILQDRIDETSWFNIFDEVYSFDVSSEAYAEINDPSELMSCYMLSKNGNGTLSEYLDGVISGDSAVNKEIQLKAEKYGNVIQALQAESLLTFEGGVQ